MISCAFCSNSSRIARSNPVGLEEHVENPASSTIFGRYPKIQKDHEAVDLICDTFRAASMNYDDPLQVEEVLDKRWKRTSTTPSISAMPCNPWRMRCLPWESSLPFWRVIRRWGRSTNRPRCLAK